MISNIDILGTVMQSRALRKHLGCVIIDIDWYGIVMNSRQSQVIDESLYPCYLLAKLGRRHILSMRYRQRNTALSLAAPRYGCSSVYHAPSAHRPPHIQASSKICISKSHQFAIPSSVFKSKCWIPPQISINMLHSIPILLCWIRVISGYHV